VQRVSPTQRVLTRRFVPYIPYRVNGDSLKISSRGLYALKALTHLAEAYDRGW
jgi:hypothetical protein